MGSSAAPPPLPPGKLITKVYFGHIWDEHCSDKQEILNNFLLILLLIDFKLHFGRRHRQVGTGRWLPPERDIVKLPTWADHCKRWSLPTCCLPANYLKEMVDFQKSTVCVHVFRCSVKTKPYLWAPNKKKIVLIVWVPINYGLHSR